MLKKEINYTDFNGDAQKDVAYFNLTTPEVTRITMKYGIQGDLQEGISHMVATDDGERLIEFMEDVILTSYGRRVDSGKQFIKSRKLKEEFEYSAAYAEMFAELLSDPKAMEEFTSKLFADTSAKVATTTTN